MKTLNYILRLSISLIITVGIYITFNLILYVVTNIVSPVNLLLTLLPAAILFNVIMNTVKSFYTEKELLLDIREIDRRLDLLEQLKLPNETLVILEKVNKHFEEANNETTQNNVIPFKKNTKI